MTKVRKKTTKQVTLRKKYSVAGKVREHHRKIKKEAKGLAKHGFKPKFSKKNPGIPNLFPEKEAMLNAMQRKQNMDAAQMENAKLMKAGLKHLPHGDLATYALEAQGKIVTYEEEALKGTAGLTGAELAEAEALMKETGELDPNSRQMAQSRRAYIKELKKVVEAADVIIEVLDARDPEGCRSSDLESQVLKQGKKLMLIINKMDLVPPMNAKAWQKHLRREFPTVLFKANTQKQSHNLSQGNTVHKKSLSENPEMVKQMTSQTAAVGTENLLNILKNYARVEGESNAKQQITVGIVGFPNVGKSSIINSLSKQKSAAVGNAPGITKSMQEIKLDRNIVLIDSPGVVLASCENADSLILRSAIRVEELADPVRPVEALISRIGKDELIKFYRIAQFENVDSFLGQVARKRGMLQNGGIANTDSAARAVIRDYMNGKLKFCTIPPQMNTGLEGDMDDDVEMSD